MRALAFVLLVATVGCNQRAPAFETPVTPSSSPTPTNPELQPGVTSVIVAPRGVDGGDGATGTVSLSGPAAIPGVIVSLSSSNEVAMVPATVVVASGTSSARFAVTTRRFPDDRVIQISASTPDRTVSTDFHVWAIEKPVFFKFFSEPDDPIGQGEVGRFLPGTSRFEASCQGNEVRIQITTPGGDAWHARFAGHPGHPLLESGSYPQVPRAGSDGDRPGLSIDRGGRACAALNGRFLITELDLRNNRVNVFRAVFEQQCAGTADSLHGDIRVENMPAGGSNCLR